MTFLPGSEDKRPDCVRRAPSNGQWIHGVGTTGTTVNTNNHGQPAYGNFKDYGSYPQQQNQLQQLQLQQQQQQHQQQPQSSQQQPSAQSQTQPLQPQSPQQQTTQPQSQSPQGQSPSHQQQQLYAAPTQNHPKNEQVPYQVINPQQFAYDSGYGTYPQGMQLVPCLCPVNKEILEQQNQQFQQQQQVTPLQASPTSETGNVGKPEKKTT
ncbi:hypothetical protein RUM44_009596 [Polyplax serrata]|uniref:Uncharacterized protein n=1 Tax=Polyplax serrata TaxID=468196 RepID=A0ABR1AT45_POLSC